MHVAAQRDLIVQAVRRVEADLPDRTIHEAISQVAATRTRVRALARSLATSSDLLTGAPPSGPIIVDQFIAALLNRGAGRVVAPSCPGCGKNNALQRWQDGLRYCQACAAKASHTACARCGTVAARAALDRAGRAVCRRCSHQDEPDAIEIVRAAVAALDPGADERAVEAQFLLAVPTAAVRRKLAWALADNPALLTGAGADGPPSLTALIEGLLAIAVNGIVRPACPRCGHQDVPLTNIADGRRCCKPCYRLSRAVLCARCGRLAASGSRSAAGEALCSYCYRADPINHEVCDTCGRLKPTVQHIDGKPLCAACRLLPVAVCTVCERSRPCLGTVRGTPRCPACVERLSKKEPCVLCGKSRHVKGRFEDGAPLCESCAALREPCATCGRTRKVHTRDQDGAAICNKCYATHPIGRRHCVRCGVLDNPHHYGLCPRCAAHRMLCRLLGGQDDAVAAGLKPVLDAFDDSDPKAILVWLRNPGPRSALAALGTAGSATHEVLDRLDAAKSAQYLRAILVSAGALPERDEAAATLQRWIPTALAQLRRGEDRKVLDSYIRWHHLRRLRTRPGRADTALTWRIRDEIRSSINLLNWLDEHRQRALSDATQADIDLWIAGKPSKHYEARSFVRWAVKHRRARGIEIPRRRITRAQSVISDEERLRIIRQLLDDTTIDMTARVAGLLVVIFAQPLNHVARIRLDQVQHDGEQVKIRFGEEPVVVPAPVDRLVLRQIEQRREFGSVGRTGSPPWLFPGLRAGEPISHVRLLKKLRAVGIFARPARHTALLDMAKDVPAPVLSSLLGISLESAARWRGVSGGDGAQYAAQVARRARRRADTPRPSE